MLSQMLKDKRSNKQYSSTNLHTKALIGSNQLINWKSVPIYRQFRLHRIRKKHGVGKQNTRTCTSNTCEATDTMVDIE